MEKDMLYRLALTRVKGIGPRRTRILISRFGEAKAVFRATPATLEKVSGIGSRWAKAIGAFKEFHAVEKELAFLEKYRISPIFFTDAAYPGRLAKNKNAPALLFYKGTADLNTAKVLSVVGTRNPTGYGRQLTEKIIAALALPDLIIVSGLAYGIDAAAHQSALRHQLPTVGVLGHGLDRIYPGQHAGLAREMLKQGGLLTEFSSGTEPDEHNFPLRNRIVAGICDALLVVETACRGGSMLTVDNAIAANKKVFAVPGRMTDPKSAGCNSLIHQGKAILLTNPQQLLQELQLGEQAPQPVINVRPKPRSPQRPLGLPSVAPDSDPSANPKFFKDPHLSTAAHSTSSHSPADLSTAALSAEEQYLLDLLRQTGALSLDELLTKDGLGGNEVSLSLLTLEMEGLICCLPGKKYQAI